MWSEGDVVVRREVLNDGTCWCELPVRVVRDTSERVHGYETQDLELDDWARWQPRDRRVV